MLSVVTPPQDLDERLRAALADLAGTAAPATPGDPAAQVRDGSGLTGALALRLFDAQLTSRHLDLAARWLRSFDEGYYTIGSAGHEGDAALAAVLRPDDPALLHYRSGAFYCARAAQIDGADPVGDVLRGLVASAREPIAGGRHKVFGHPDLTVVPTTSTIASHLPRAVGVAFAIGRAHRIAAATSAAAVVAAATGADGLPDDVAETLTTMVRTALGPDTGPATGPVPGGAVSGPGGAAGDGTPWPADAVVVASFGDASVNHATATAAFNAAGWCDHTGVRLPLLFVCEDNGLGISVRSPDGWVARTLRSRPGLRYFAAAGCDLTA